MSIMESEMNNIINFNIDTILDNKIFYEYIWKKFYQIIVVARKKYIILDFRNVKIVKPEVLPKLCCLGLISKRYGIDIEINLNPFSEVKEFLGNIGFFDIVNKNEIFKLNEGQIGGKNKKSNVTNSLVCFEANSILKKYEKKFIFNDDINESDRLKYCIEAEIFGENYIFTPGEITEEMIIKSPILTVLSEMCGNNIYLRNQFLNNLGLDFTELIHNSLWHGKTRCFFSVQAATYYKDKIDKEFKRIDICVSDSGMGLYESLRKKEWAKDKRSTCTLPLDKIFSLSSERDKNFYSILEMIYYREEDKDRGVYDIMKNLVDKKRLAINIINRSTQIYLNNEKLREVLEKDYKGKIFPRDKETIGYGFSIDISFSI